jgi:adenylate kinase family enzyme
MRVVIAGPPAAGKSTLARQIAPAGAEVIDFDEIAVEMGSPNGHDHPPMIRKAAREEMDRRLAVLAPDAVVISSSPRRRDRSALAERVRAERVIVLAVPADEAKRRAVTDRRPEWTAEQIDRWWARYEPASGEEVRT